MSKKRRHTQLNPNFVGDYDTDLSMSNPQLILNDGVVHADYIQVSHFAYPGHWLCSTRFKDLLETHNAPFEFYQNIVVQGRAESKVYHELHLNQEKRLPPDFVNFEKSKFKLVTPEGEESISVKSYDEFKKNYPVIVNLRLCDNIDTPLGLIITQMSINVFINETLKNDIIDNKITGFEIHENHPDFDYSKRFWSDDFRVY